MSAKIKTKVKDKLVIPCTHCFEPVYIKFNFAYITYDKNFEDEYKLQFLKRMREMSSMTYNAASAWGRERFFEFEEIEISKEIPQGFRDRFSSKTYNNKFAIMRLYPNNNPILARIIGVMIKKVFYVFYIDIGGKLYKH